MKAGDWKKAVDMAFSQAELIGGGSRATRQGMYMGWGNWGGAGITPGGGQTVLHVSPELHQTASRGEKAGLPA